MNKRNDIQTTSPGFVHHSPRLLLAFTILGFLCTANAQEIDPDEPPGEEIYDLSPFVVDVDQDVGYVATSTLSGTRIRTKLSDLASSISVLTKEFLEDVDANSNEQLLVYATNIEVGGQRSNYVGVGTGQRPREEGTFANPNLNTRVRGLAAADNTRNFFVTEVPWDGYIVDRVDLQRGPNAILFGLGSPAGIINATLQGADFLDDGELEFRVDNFGSTRFVANINREILEDELAVRVAGLVNNEEFFQDPAYSDDKRLYGAFRYRPEFLRTESSSLVISGNVESGDVEANRPRYLPPFDRLTPFYDPVEAGGMGGVLYNPYDFENVDPPDEETLVGGPNEGDPNPNYVPRVGRAPLQGGPVYIWGSVRDPNVSGPAFLAGTKHASNLQNPDTRGNENYIWWPSLDNTLVTPRSYPDYATTAGLPNVNQGIYKAQMLTDPSVFDFYDNLIDGPNKMEFQEWTTYEFDIAHTFFNNRLGYNIALFDQVYKEGSSSAASGDVSSGNVLYIDATSHLPYGPGTTYDQGVPNPNAGRPFVVANYFANASIRDIDRDAQRFQGFASWDFNEDDNGGFLEMLLGEHRFTGLYSQDNQETDEREFYRFHTPPEYFGFANESANHNRDGIDYRMDFIHYLGDPIHDRSSASGARIPNIKVARNFPDELVVSYFDSTWTAGPGVDPDALWAEEGVNELYGWRTTTPEGENPIFQGDNPANFLGWQQATFPFGDGMTNARIRDDNTRRAALVRRETESKVFVWQGFLWNDAIIGTWGWREDTQDSAIVTAEVTDPRGVDLIGSPYMVDLGKDWYSFSPSDDRQEVARDSVTGESINWGVAVHLNRLFPGVRAIEEMPLLVSLYYNEGENFQPAAGRIDVRGNPIAAPQGETEDMAILFATPDQRFSFKITKYETTVTDASSEAGFGGTEWVLDLMLSWGTAARNAAVGTAESDLGSADWYADAGGEIPVTLADAAADWDAMLAELQADWGDFIDAWGFNSVGGIGIFDPTFASEDGGKQPAGYTLTQDTVSEGWEFELTANITDNWQLLINASKTEAIRKNVGGQSTADLVAFYDKWLLNSDAGNIAIFWPGGTIGGWMYQDLGFRSAYQLVKLAEENAVSEGREWAWNVVTNYDFDERFGIFENFSVGGAWRYRDDKVIGYPLTTDAEGFTVFDVNSPIKGGQRDFFDFWVRYQHEFADGLLWTLQLNVNDAFGDKGLEPLSLQPDASGQITSSSPVAAALIEPGRTWSITSSIRF